MQLDNVKRSRELWDELSKEVTHRVDNSLVEDINMMADMYENKLPAEYDKYFPSGSIRHTVGLVKLAWDDLATSIGRRPDFRVDAVNESDAEEKRVGKLERIAHGYLDRAEPHGDIFMWLLAWWLVGAGRAVALVRPGKDKLGQPSPIFTIRDPRTAWPSMQMVNNIPTHIWDIAFKYEIPRRTASALGLCEDKPMVAEPAGEGDRTKVQIIEFIDDKQWVIASEEGYYAMDEHGLGECPAWVFQSFAPNQTHGLSLFRDQVSMQVAVSQLISLKLASADRNVNPIYWAKGHQGTIKIGPNQLTKLAGNGEIGILAPPMIPQVDRDIETLMGLSRLLNKNPEVRQGEIASKGQYTSAKTLEQLSEAIDTVVGKNWDQMSVGLQHLMRIALQMDEKMWPDVERTITTNVKGKSKRTKYTPAKDINGRYHVNIDYGFGLGGYQGFLQHLQANQAGAMSRKRMIEQMPGTSDVDQELRQMELESLDASQQASIMAQAQQGALDMVQLSKIRKKVAEGGMPLHEAVLEMQEELAEQAAAAAQQEGGVQPLTNPGEAPVEEQAPALPGLPPPALV